jgi:DNA-binding PadR family transcriptional regulator
VRRRPGTLLPIETAILDAALQLRDAGEEQFHGFRIAKHLADGVGASRLTAHGTLYKALGRLEGAGLLTSVWEDPAVATDEARPRRRLYAVTVAAQQALAESRAADVVRPVGPQ